ncbi:D-2-hydroxyacid dehydrogenase [Aerococcaceae bacterium WGS1372]
MVKLIAYHVSDEEAQIINQWSQTTGIEVKMVKEELSLNSVHQAEGYDAITNGQVSNVDSRVYPILKGYGIKAIGQRSAGFEMYDINEARQYDITITNVPSYSPESIAEFTIFAILRQLRNIALIDQRVEEQNFSWEPVIRSRPLNKLTVAVIGVGRIGSRVASILKNGFGAKVLAYDIEERAEFRDIVDYQEDLLSAVKDADIITLHMPATTDNYRQFNKELFSKLKKGVILINAARGRIVDTEDLIEALNSGHVQSAALDVYEYEGPYMPKNWESRTIEDPIFQKLLDHPRIYYTPHIAYYTDEAVKNLVEGGLNSALEVVKNGHAINQVN